MQPDIIETDEEFRELCNHIRSEQLVGFDTEFVSDNTFRPVLGLLQFATRSRSTAVDPLAVKDLTPWWEIMADDATTVIVHGGQAEIKFCLDLLGKAPSPTVRHSTSRRISWPQLSSFLFSDRATRC